MMLLFILTGCASFGGGYIYGQIQGAKWLVRILVRHDPGFPLKLNAALRQRGLIK